MNSWGVPEVLQGVSGCLMGVLYVFQELLGAFHDASEHLKGFQGRCLDFHGVSAICGGFQGCSKESGSF